MQKKQSKNANNIKNQQNMSPTKPTVLQMCTTMRTTMRNPMYRINNHNYNMIKELKGNTDK